MTPDVSHAVQLLLEARRSGTQIAPPFALPDRSAVYAIQDGVAAATGPVAGWKVGARTSTAEPAGAPLFAGTLTPSPARFDGTAMHMIGIEVEISFHIVRDIAARTAPVERDEALAAVGDAFVGMEVVDTRIADFQKADPEWLLADNQMNHALVVGDPVKNWKALDWPALQVRLEIDGQTIVDQRGGLGAVDPLRPLAWMIDHAVRTRGGLRAGQAITTGSWTGLRYFPPGTRARGSFVGLGAVEASF
ncbi:MAG: fumarylacetoacetate hydrolase family protein [Reyranella sp.]|uniref:2-keto-4-pentenoate hydratase n=1 Tax=Reyranella sp. TaxID=1929291 RepID=UPI0025CF6317|nr:fumarylacetoacetate hydrolase family protein [Reyranella sp.]MBR2815178.1 fumarylacetoacetate hydrolase family protein [Reyranella sp.]